MLWDDREQTSISESNTFVQYQAKLGKTDGYLCVTLQRNPELAPARKSSKAWVWIDEDTERVRQWMNRRENRRAEIFSQEKP